MFGKKKKGTKKFRRYIMYSLGFILAVSVALPAYLQSSFLRQHLSLALVSAFFVGANAITALMIALFPKLIHKLGNYFSAKLLIIVYAASLIGLATSNDATSATFTLLLFIITSNLLWINIDILLESVSADNKTGRIRTVYLTIMNLGWIVAPTASAFLVELGNYPFAFLAAAVVTLPLFLIIVSQRHNLKDSSKYHKESILKSLRKMWQSRNLRGIFMSAIALNLFFSSAVIYIPIYLHQNLGIGWEQLGWIFSFMLLPFIIFEIPAGIIADKYLGEKEMLFLGLLIILLSLVLFATIKSSTPWIWAFTLFFSRVGAALVEAMRDSYFFKNVSVKDVGFINIFRITGPIGYIVGASIASLALLLMPVNSIFLIFAAFLLPVFYFVALIKDTK